MQRSFTLDEVNRLKIIQDVVDRRLTTQMAAQRLGISDRQCRRLLSRYRESGPLGMANRRRGNPAIISCLMALRGMHSVLYVSAMQTLGRLWRVKSLQNCTMSTCPKKLSGRSWLKPVSTGPRKQRAPKFSSHAIAGPVVAN